MTKLVFVVIAVASAAYVLTLHLVLNWLSQFPWYAFVFNAFFFSLGAVLLGGVILWWADERSDRHWAAEIAQIFLQPCAFYLGAIASVLYLLALAVLAPFLLPFWLLNK